MNRRDAIRALGAATAVPFFAQASFADQLVLGREVRARMPAEGDWILKTLDAHQNQTVTVVAELIIPETDTPGATAARVNEFIDLILTEWYTEDERTRFLQGLDELDERTRAAYGEAFVNCTKDEQVQTLTALDAEVADSRQADSPGARAQQHFFHQMKRLTLIGYYTSEVGMTEELNYEIIPGQFDGCVPLTQG